MSDSPNGWPCPTQLGVPLDADRPGLHWITDALHIPRLARWTPTPNGQTLGFWKTGNGQQGAGVDWGYVGPAVKGEALD